MTVRSTLTTALVAATATAATMTGAAALLSGPASAAGHLAAGAAGAAGAGGWERSPSDGFVSPAGDLCRHALRSETLLDEVWVRTTRTFADGSPRRQEYAGPLVVRLSDETTGASVERDLSGRAVVTHHRDGSFDYAISGPVAVGFHDGDGLRRGYYVLDGYHVVRFAADGTRSVVVDRGTERDVCRDLARAAR